MWLVNSFHIVSKRYAGRKREGKIPIHTGKRESIFASRFARAGCALLFPMPVCVHTSCASRELMIDEHWILIVRLIALMLSLSRWKISFAARFRGDGFSEISNLPLDLRIQLYCYRNNSRFILAKIEIYRKILFSHLFYNIYDIFVSFEFAYYNYPILYVIVIFSLYCNNSFVTSLTLIIFQPTNFLKKKKKKKQYPLSTSTSSHYHLSRK